MGAVHGDELYAMRVQTADPLLAQNKIPRQTISIANDDRSYCPCFNIRVQPSKRRAVERIATVAVIEIL